MKVQEVFTPNDTPTHTYVSRPELNLEEKLRDYFETPNMVISVSGPSKSGKSVLINKVIPSDLHIRISGASIKTAEDLWTKVLSWMDVPSTIEHVEEKGDAVTGSAEANVQTGVFGMFKAGAKTTVQGEVSGKSGTKRAVKLDPMTSVIKEIGGSEFVVFIDDFHYIAPEAREELGRQIKSAMESRVKFLAASVPHRTDDVVRSNSELNGRVAAVDLGYWSQEELLKISEKGFAALNLIVSKTIESNIAKEALGSPQLMQAICLNFCLSCGIRNSQPKTIDLSNREDAVQDALLRTSSFTDFSKTVTSLHGGPRIRGTERKPYQYTDGSNGDVYRGVLLSIANSPKLSLSYDDLIQVMRTICKDETPIGSSIVSTLEQMNELAESLRPNNSPISWDGDVLDITDPYFLFFLRHSEKLNTLGA